MVLKVDSQIHIKLRKTIVVERTYYRGRKDDISWSKGHFSQIYSQY